MRITLPFLLAFGLSGCAALNSVSVTPIPANRSQSVTASASRWVILGLNFDNDFADDVSRRLSEKCPNGRISGILTKDETFFYFLFFVIRKDVSATGYCERYGIASAGHNKGHGRKYNSVEDGAPPNEEGAPE